MTDDSSSESLLLRRCFGSLGIVKRLVVRLVDGAVEVLSDVCTSETSSKTTNVWPPSVK